MVTTVLHMVLKAFLWCQQIRHFEMRAFTHRLASKCISPIRPVCCMLDQFLA